MGHYASEILPEPNLQREATYELYRFLSDIEIPRLEMLDKARKYNDNLPITLRMFDFMPNIPRELNQTKELRRIVGKKVFETKWDLKENGGWK